MRDPAVIRRGCSRRPRLAPHCRPKGFAIQTRQVPVIDSLLGGQAADAGHEASHGPRTTCCPIQYRTLVCGSLGWHQEVRRWCSTYVGSPPL